jgi:hypothetical protein
MIILAVLMVIAASNFFKLQKYKTDAIVVHAEGDSAYVQYMFHDILYESKMQMPSDDQCTQEGDVIEVFVDENDPTVCYPSEGRYLGGGLLVSGILLTLLAWLMIYLVSDSRNIAAAAGLFSFLQLIVI